jgi:hypothetical protein
MSGPGFHYSLRAIVLWLYVRAYQGGFTTGLAGMVFPGLLSPCFLPAIFGLGQEHRGTICLPRPGYADHDIRLSLLVAQPDKTEPEPDFGFLIFVGMAVWQGLLVKDDYGLYKILFLGSLVWIPALFWAERRLRFRTGTNSTIGSHIGTIILLAGAIAQRMEQQDRIPWAKVTL